jgi:hypothetical protein
MAAVEDHTMPVTLRDFLGPREAGGGSRSYVSEPQFQTEVFARYLGKPFPFLCTSVIPPVNEKAEPHPP